MSSIFLTLAVEDVLSERVATKVIEETRKDIQVGMSLGRRGNAYLKEKAQSFNLSSAGHPFLLLTDQDVRNKCPPTIITDWLGGNPCHPNFMFRVAVLEVEAWLMADREQLAKFLTVPLVKIPEDVEMIDDPKRFLVNLARSAPNSALREALVPKPGSTTKVGPDYNGRLAEFVQSYWSSKRARRNSQSLNRFVRRIRDFRPI